MRRMLVAVAVVAAVPAETVWAAAVEIKPVNPAMIAPFVLLLASIAMVPFINRHFWERYYPVFAVVLGAVTLFYYTAILDNVPRVVLSAHEYFSFIVLIGSLFVVSGGIHITIKGTATPGENVLTLALGGVIANLLGTTGASMVLIRPYIRSNRARIAPYHVVFFIFLVSNMGGLLTPIGDPPLFLGYLKGVPFFWVLQRTYLMWLVGLVIVLTIFYMTDRYHFARAPAEVRERAKRSREDIEFSGMQNFVFLGVILGAVFIQRPPLVREAIMIMASAASYLTTRREIHHRNEFNLVPIKEVAILFAGIFATMMPALDWLELNGQRLGLTMPGHFYWCTGALSAVLDNAPTYLTFLSAAFGLFGLAVDDTQHMSHFLVEHSRFVVAISAGAVFFGAMTYIGNGPNFMVKSVAEHAHVRCPSFFGYVFKYSLPILLPTFAVVYLVFLRD